MGTINYNRTGDIIEFVIRDFSGRKLESDSCNVRDKKKYAKLLQYYKDKYGFEPAIDIDDVPKKEVDWWE